MDKKTGTLVAKYVERKMSPSTGLDTDYVYEWRLVKHTDVNEIYKGGKYGIYRFLTVNGDTRYNDLMGFGDTPTEAAHTTPVETNLDKAEKFGVLKTKFDKEVAKQKTKEVEKEATEQRELDDSARFESVFSPLRTLKGVKEIDIQVATFPDYKNKVMVARKGYDIGCGIGIAIAGEGKYKTYTVTHLNTGLGFGSGHKDRKEAVALARVEGMLADWSKYQTDKDVPKEIMAKAAALSRATADQKLGKELAEDLDKGIEKQFAEQYREAVRKSVSGRPRAEVVKDAEKALAEMRGEHKAPWEMSREEWRDAKQPSYEFYKEMGWPEGHVYDREPGYRYGTSHLGWIKTAIHKGKTVPPEILKIYPQLLEDETIRVLKPETYKQIEKAIGKKESAIIKQERRGLGSGDVPDIGNEDNPVKSQYGLPAYRKNGFWYIQGYSMSGSGDRVWQRITDPRSQNEIDALYPDDISIDAVQMGLTSAQLVQAREEGVTTAIGLRRVAKNSRGGTSLQSLESSRSPLSQSSDERQEHSLIIEPDDPRISTWKRDPGRMDVRGIDTPARATKHTRRKHNRKSPPTSLQSTR
jgi:hypothetical protein